MTEKLNIKILKDVSFHTQNEGWTYGVFIEFPNGLQRNIWLGKKDSFEESVRCYWNTIKDDIMMRDKINILLKNRVMEIEV